MTEPGTDLDRQDPAKPLPVLAGKELDETFRIAKAMALSGLFKDAKQAEQAFAKIVVGRDLGLNPAESMAALHVIEGKVEASADLHATRVKASDKYDYRIVALDNFVCEITFWQHGEEIGTSTFTMDDAEAAGLAKKDPWKKYPRNMLFARAMSNGVAWYCPDVMGGLRVYHEGEIEVRDVSAGSGDYTEPRELLAAIKEWAPDDLAEWIYGTIDRAKRLGHAGYSDYGSIELKLKGQPTKNIINWVEVARHEMDKMESEPRPSEDESLTAEILESRALQKIDEADALEAEAGTDPLTNQQVEELRADAASLHDQAEAMKQQEMEV